MNSFKEWFIKEDATLGTEFVVDQISSVYNKAKLAIKLVQEYDKTLKPGYKLLPNINTVAQLSADPHIFGLYKTDEKKKIISNKVPPQIADKIKTTFRGKEGSVPEITLHKYFPQLKPEDVLESDMIRINVNSIVRSFGDTPRAVLEIAKSIVHEATHELEHELKGATQDGPGTAVEKAEDAFENWAIKGAGKGVFQQIMKEAFPGQQISL
jgi:hypothetical protein